VFKKTRRHTVINMLYVVLRVLDIVYMLFAEYLGVYCCQFFIRRSTFLYSSIVLFVDILYRHYGMLFSNLMNGICLNYRPR